MEILLLPKYGRKAASCRYRFLQYVPYLESLGIKCTISPLFDDDYLEKKYQTGRNDVVDVAKAFFRRLMTIVHLHKYDLVVIHCEMFPYLPPLFERYLILRKIKYIFDYDDAIFHNYDQSPNMIMRWLFKEKIITAIEGAKYVIAGSQYLADYALRANKNVEVIPTVIDINKYPVRKLCPAPAETFTIGWIGSPSTAKYVEEIGTALSEICDNDNTKIILIGAGRVNLPGVNYENLEWSEESEITNMQLFDVGIMPLSDGLWEKGKCGFKLIQYMACGLPVVASPVGVNSMLVEEGKNGFLVKTIEDWVRVLSILRDDRALRQRLGECGRKIIENQYCLQVTAPRYIALMQNIIKENTNESPRN
jgi:glycosyltransferase involved in cell wall biosynthesis